ncbi:unnamed protein product [Gadus morhua 'NCC']
MIIETNDQQKQGLHGRPSSTLCSSSSSSSGSNAKAGRHRGCPACHTARYDSLAGQLVSVCWNVLMCWGEEEGSYFTRLLFFYVVACTWRRAEPLKSSVWKSKAGGTRRSQFIGREAVGDCSLQLTPPLVRWSRTCMLREVTEANMTPMIRT